MLESKLDVFFNILHCFERVLCNGHSYTAYPTGCAVAAKAMSMYRDPEFNPNLRTTLPSGGGGGDFPEAHDFDVVRGKGSESESPGRLQELWDEALVKEISMYPSVKRVIAIGTVFAAELDVGDQAGYSSGAAREIVLKLRKFSIQARPLGNVLYLMVTPTTPRERCTSLLLAVQQELMEMEMGDDEDM